MSTRLCTSLFALAAMFGQAWAVNKCQVDGRVVYQELPCPGKGEAINATPAAGHTAAGSDGGLARIRAESAEADRRIGIRMSIERREPAIGMTEDELTQAMGRPHRVNLANYNGVEHDQLIYERGGRTIYVYTRAGIVRSIQNTDNHTRPAAGQQPRCLTPQEISALETSASSITLGDAERAARRREIADARKCGR